MESLHLNHGLHTITTTPSQRFWVQSTHHRAARVLLLPAIAEPSQIFLTCDSAKSSSLPQHHNLFPQQLSNLCRSSLVTSARIAPFASAATKPKRMNGLRCWAPFEGVFAKEYRGLRGPRRIGSNVALHVGGQRRRTRIWTSSDTLK